MKTKLKDQKQETIDKFNEHNSRTEIQLETSCEPWNSQIKTSRMTRKKANSYTKLLGDCDGYTKTVTGDKVEYVSESKQCKMIIYPVTETNSMKLPEYLKKNILTFEFHKVLESDCDLRQKDNFQESLIVDLARKFATQFDTIDRQYIFKPNRELYPEMTEIEFRIAMLIKKEGEKISLNKHHMFIKELPVLKVFQSLVKKINKKYFITEECIQTQELDEIIGIISVTAFRDSYFTY